MQSLRWTVSQIGARQHYGVPRGFSHQGDLRALYTDSWCRGCGWLLKHGTRQLRAFAGRYHRELHSQQVHAYTFRTAWDRWLRGTREHTTEAVYGEYLRSGMQFARWVTQDLRKQRLDPARDVFLGFNTGALETLEMLRERNILTIVDQIDPARTEEDLVLREAQLWPGWQELAGRIPDAYFERLSAEWAAATLVLVNSEWARTALIAQGVPAEKLLIVPVAYEAAITSPRDVPEPNGPLTVLWLGTVNLRKGIPYLVGAARLLQRSNIRFVVAGPLQISREAVKSAPANMTFLGRITRDQAEAQYGRANLFVLPTISDGFAITQVEAMAHGLPVITTDRCGEVVTHGIDGLLVPVGDERALAEAIAKLDADRDLLHAMSRQALHKATMFHLPRQAALIEMAVRRFRQGLALEAAPVQGVAA